MIKETLEKILNTLEKCCEETHQNHKSDYQIRRQLFDILSKNNPNNIKEYDISVLNEDKQDDFRQQDELFPRNEKWYLVCNKEDSKTDTLLLCDKIKDIPCNVIFNNCNIDLRIDESKGVKKDNTETIKNCLYFYNCAFEKSLNLKNIIFEKTLTFNQCVFYNNLEIHQNQFLDHLVFINCHDNQDKKITSLDLQENEFKGYFFIKNCAIEKINLWKNKFKNRCYFIDSVFGNKNNENIKLNFSNAHFEDNAYFNNSEFYSYADFHECEFEKIACFYGVKLHKIPNFSACYFKEQKAANLINVDIDKLDFKSVEKYIEDNYKDESYKNETKGIQDEKEIFKIQNEYRLRYAKNLKDSFRVIKDVLITQNNTLEAQEWHKLELYAKERELLFEVESCYKEKNKPFIAAKSEDKNSINLTFSVLLLWIYRVTSLHHTNLPRIINFTSLNIVAFGLLVCLITYLSYHIDKQTNFWFLGVFILSVLVMAIVYLTLKKHKLKSIRLILFIFLAFLMALFLIQSITLLHLFSDVIFALFLYCLLVIALICLYPYINSISFVSYCFNWLVYFFLVMVVVIKPQLINPFAGIFSSDKLYESQFEKSLNDLNASAIVNLASILQNDFNLHLKDQNISFTELNSAKALIIANKEKLKEILKVYDDKYESDYKKVLNELENNTSNVKNVIEEIDNKNNNSVISVQLNQILNFNFSQEIDILYMIKSNFFISEKLSPEQMALFDQKDSQDKLKSVLALLKFKSSFEGILEVINQDEIIQNTIKSTSVLYSIILLLCIFSLQKTARKNSIVPS
ncbi:pentapeptide repeat-containing protein [Campylobacter jejuni]